MKIIIGVLSCLQKEYQDLVFALKQTCFKNIPAEFEVYYIYGNGQCDGKYMMENSDFYSSYRDDEILSKTIDFFKYCNTYKKFDYILRTNTACYWNLKLYYEHILNTVPKTNAYYGPIGDDPNVIKGQGRFISGAGYLLSKDLISKIISNEKIIMSRHFTHHVHDDVSIGKFLYKDCGVPELECPPNRIFVKASNINSKLDRTCYNYYCENHHEPIRPNLLHTIHQYTKQC